MKIIVLLKQVPDPHSYVEMKEDGTLDREKSKAVINPYDKNALESALEIKEKYNGNVKITVISMGPPKAEDALREALAMGADEAILLSDMKLAGSDTLATSYTLSKAIKKLKDWNLILCGMEASDGNTGQVGPEVAEHLSIPQITFIERFEIKDGNVIGMRILERGYEKLKAKLPVLLTIINSKNEPRETTFSGVIKAMNSKIKKWSSEDINVDEKKIGLKGSPTKLKKIEKTKIKRDKSIIQGKNLDEIIEKFMNKLKEDRICLTEKNGKGA
jgi:electron transfer flavoprotein beta subunit